MCIVYNKDAAHVKFVKFFGQQYDMCMNVKFKSSGTAIVNYLNIYVQLKCVYECM